MMISEFSCKEVAAACHVAPQKATQVETALFMRAARLFLSDPLRFVAGFCRACEMVEYERSRRKADAPPARLRVRP